MALEAWNDLTLTEKRKIRKGFIRNPHKAYERLRAQADGSDTPEPTPTPDPEPTPTTHNLNFIVTDGSNPIQGATVTIGEITGTTGSAGGCTLSGVTGGEQTVTVSADGFEAYSDTITVDSEHLSFTISLTATVPMQELSIPVTVYDYGYTEEDVPLAGAEVKATSYKAYGESAVPITMQPVITDANGEATLIVSVPADLEIDGNNSITVRADKEGYTFEFGENDKYVGFAITEVTLGLYPNE